MKKDEKRPKMAFTGTFDFHGEKRKRCAYVLVFKYFGSFRAFGSLRSNTPTLPPTPSETPVPRTCPATSLLSLLGLLEESPIGELVKFE